MSSIKPEIIRYGHIDDILERIYLEKMGKKLFGKEFMGFYKETTFMHPEGFMTRKIEPIKITPAKELREVLEKTRLIEKQSDKMARRKKNE